MPSDPIIDMATLLRIGGEFRLRYEAHVRSYVAKHYADNGTITIATAPYSLEDAVRAVIERIEETALSDTDRPPSAAALLAGADPIGGQP